jgi:hypothetical protein
MVRRLCTYDVIDIQMNHRTSRLKLLPRCLPLLYCFTRALNSLGGGKSFTGNVCGPAIAGGVGTVDKYAQARYIELAIRRPTSASRRCTTRRSHSVEVRDRGGSAMRRFRTAICREDGRTPRWYVRMRGRRAGPRGWRGQCGRCGCAFD